MSLELKVGFEPTRAYADGLQDRCHQPLGDLSICIFDRRLVDSVSRRPHSHFFNPVHDMKGGW